MKIIMVSGIRTPREQLWMEFRQAFNRRLPDATFCVVTEPNCNLWEVDRFRARVLRAVAVHDTGEDILLVGHSLGGVMACAMQVLMQNSHVIGITTIHSPHQFFFGICTRLLFANDVSAPVLSFQGLHDGLVWWGTKHPRAVRHVRNNSNHFHDLWEHTENVDLIADTTVDTFLKTK